MKSFIVHDGINILRSGRCKDCDYELQAGPGEFLMEGEAAPNRQQIRDGQIIDREIVEPAYDVRPDRNALLASTDWTQLPDSPLSDEKKQLWKQYRQALRDMPAASDTIWPDRPE